MKIDFWNACNWAESAVTALEYEYPKEDYDQAMMYVKHFLGLSVQIPEYTFQEATNLPWPESNGYFVSCSKRDMQPYMCDTILADDLPDAWDIAFRNAEKYGEQYAMIQGESFEFYYEGE
jgi:hypothetical protein